jgi:hypothetical protein
MTLLPAITQEPRPDMPDEYQLGRDISANSTNIAALTERMARTESQLERLMAKLDPIIVWTEEQIRDDEADKAGNRQVGVGIRTTRSTWPLIVSSSIAGALFGTAGLTLLAKIAGIH